MPHKAEPARVYQFDPLPNLGRDVSHAGAIILDALETKRKRQRAQEIINQLPESDKELLIGLEDPDDITRAALILSKHRAAQAAKLREIYFRKKELIRKEELAKDNQVKLGDYKYYLEMAK